MLIRNTRNRSHSWTRELKHKVTAKREYKGRGVNVKKTEESHQKNLSWTQSLQQTHTNIMSHYQQVYIQLFFVLKWILSTEFVANSFRSTFYPVLGLTDTKTHKVQPTRAHTQWYRGTRPPAAAFKTIMKLVQHTRQSSQPVSLNSHYYSKCVFFIKLPFPAVKQRELKLSKCTHLLHIIIEDCAKPRDEEKKISNRIEPRRINTKPIQLIVRNTRVSQVSGCHSWSTFTLHLFLLSALIALILCVCDTHFTKVLFCTLSQTKRKTC